MEYSKCNIEYSKCTADRILSKIQPGLWKVPLNSQGWIRQYSKCGLAAIYIYMGLSENVGYIPNYSHLIVTPKSRQDLRIPSTLWWTNIAMENGHRNSGFSHEKWWFSIAMLVHQRVYQWEFQDPKMEEIIFFRILTVFHSFGASFLKHVPQPGVSQIPKTDVNMFIHGTHYWIWSCFQSLV